MYDLLKAFTVAAAVACAAPAQRADGLSTGTELLQVGDTYVLSEHGDWDLRCIRAPEGQQDPCQLFQLLEDNGGNPVAQVNLFNLPGDDELAAGATIVTPRNCEDLPIPLLQPDWVLCPRGLHRRRCSGVQGRQ